MIGVFLMRNWMALKWISSSSSSRFRNSSGYNFFKIRSHIFINFEVKLEE